VPCYHPVRAYGSAEKSPVTGKKVIAFNPRRGVSVGLELPCGQCIGCRIERTRQWAVRILHETKLHSERSWFVTLTYDDQHVPFSLCKSHFQTFIRSVRSTLGSVRYYHCGEYGEHTSRPHYHAILFGLAIPDVRVVRQSEGGNYYESATLNALWGKGFVQLGDVTHDSAAYVAGYVQKKLDGDLEAHYMSLDPSTGEINRRLPPYSTMSRRPGIGAGYVELYSDELLAHDNIVQKSKERAMPRYYEKRLELINPDRLEANKKARRDRANNSTEVQFNNTTSRLRVRETVAKAKQSLKRKTL